MHLLVYLHTIHFTVHCPFDIFELGTITDADALASAQSLNSTVDQWPFSQIFTIAEQHAMTVSQLVRTSISAGLAGGPVVRAEAGSLPALWSSAVIRACWVHVL